MGYVWNSILRKVSLYEALDNFDVEVDIANIRGESPSDIVKLLIDLNSNIHSMILTGSIVLKLFGLIDRRVIDIDIFYTNLYCGYLYEVIPTTLEIDDEFYAVDRRELKIYRKSIYSNIYGYKYENENEIKNIISIKISDSCVIKAQHPFEIIRKKCNRRCVNDYIDILNIDEKI